MRPKATDSRNSISIARFHLWYGLLLFVFVIFIVRLFYLQVIQHDYYKLAALKAQFKQYEIPADRGIIVARDGNQEVPIVLNEPVFTAFADPKYVKDPKAASQAVANIIGGEPSKYESIMREDTRYAVLAKKLSKEKSDQITNLKLKGIGTREGSQRTYPQGTLASQVLGFVNDEGKGTYGIEQYLDSQLGGKPGELKAITDARGIPLVSNSNNVLREPQTGERIALTLDISMQRRIEDMLKAHLTEVKAPSGSIVVMDPNNGEIKAMANYPTYNPAEFSKVTDPKVFTNPNVSEPLEVGSIMKTLTVGAGLNEGVVNTNTTYSDPGFWKIGDATVKNVEEDGGAATRSVADILRYSLNTGATYILMQLGGGQINEQGRTKWHDYMTNHYRLGQKTGIEQGYEADGYIPSPTEGFGLNITYANTAFGQAMTATPIQMASAFSATINGGIYYQPHLVEPKKSSDVKVLNSAVIKPEVSEQLRVMHENSVQKNYTFLVKKGYRIGGKTGTAQITKPGGGYYDDRFNGTFVGYVGGDKPQYVIMVKINEPKVPGYAGRAAAAPLFLKTTNMLIDNYSVRGVN
jgi:cell division protein FtsI/penicillin-binding protein 2